MSLSSTIATVSSLLPPSPPGAGWLRLGQATRSRPLLKVRCVYFQFRLPSFVPYRSPATHRTQATSARVDGCKCLCFLDVQCTNVNPFPTPGDLHRALPPACSYDTNGHQGAVIALDYVFAQTQFSLASVWKWHRCCEPKDP